MKATVLATISAVSVAACQAPDAAAPGAPAPLVFEATDLRLLGSPESLAWVVDLDVLPDGRVWVLNSIEPHFVGFASDGSPLGEHGRTGSGPEELGRPVGLVTGGLQGEAWALDVGRHALVRASLPESAWVTIPLPAESLPPLSLVGARDVGFTRVRTARLLGEVVVPRSAPVGGSGWLAMWAGIWGADLVAFAPGTDSSHTVVGLLEELGDPRPYAPPTPRILPFPPWFRLWAVCGDAIRVHDRLRNEIRGFNPTGAEMSPIALPEPVLRSVSQEAFAMSMLEAGALEAAGSLELTPPRVDTVRLLASLRPRIQGDGEELAALLPRYVDLHCDDDGAIWLRPFALDEGGLRGGRSWLRIDAHGRSAGRPSKPLIVRFPARFDPMRFTGGRIWGVVRSELDVPSIAWIEW